MRTPLVISLLLLAATCGCRRAATPSRHELPAITERPILYTSTLGNPKRLRLHLMNRDGSSVQRVGTGEAMELDPTWSRDGNLIAFAALADMATVNYDIFVARADGSERRRLTHTRADQVALAPSLSPDGARVAYSLGTLRQGQPPALEVWSVELDGTGAHKIADGTLPAYSPDGWRLAYTAFDLTQGFTPAIFVSDPNGQHARPLTFPNERALAPAWSPDGTRIAYVAASARGGKPDLYVMEADGSDKRAVTHTDDRFEIGPAWLGDEILFTRVRENGRSLRTAIYAIGVDGTGERALTDYEVNHVSGNGAGFFLILLQGQPGSLWE